MSETKHTPEPWACDQEVCVIFGPQGAYVGETFYPDDARRIVACVNACAGISNEVLESTEYSIKAELDSLDAQIFGRLKAENERDELLAALTHAATDYIDQNGSVPSWWTDKIRQMVKPHA